jgi:CBS domain-containing protein
MKVKDAMHKGVDWVSPGTPVTELAKLMCEHDIGSIPIGENDQLIGMVTDRDISAKDWRRTASMPAARPRVM